jgi:hypothetical protein
VAAAEEFPGLGPASGPLELGKAGSSSNGKKSNNKKNKAGGNKDQQKAGKKQAAEPTSLSSIADFLGKNFLHNF